MQDDPVGGPVTGLVAAVDALRLSPDPTSMGDVVRAARAGAGPPEVAHLASVLAHSGTLRRPDDLAADVASSGGPGSLSTLLGPLALRVAGRTVPKVGVPGRPAGGVDVLGTVPGYRTALSADEFERVLAACGYAHTVAGADLAPLDGVLFAYRQRVAAQALVPLVVASLLAKKLAAGVSSVVLDVRVGAGGNLGATAGDARAAARLFVDTARCLDVRAVCVLSDTAAFPQPFVGRGEALVATALAVGVADPPGWLPGPAVDALAVHVDECRRAAALAVPAGAAGPPGRGELGGGASGREAWKREFKANLAAQGAATGAFERRVGQVLDAPAVTFRAPTDGVVTVDPVVLRDAVVGANRTSSAAPGTGFADAAGVTLLAPPGTAVSAGEPVVRVRGALRLTDTGVRVVEGGRPRAGPAQWHGETLG